MSRYFFCDDTKNIKISWEDLIQILNTRKEYQPVARHAEPLEVFIQILLSLLSGKPLTIIDSDLSNEETKRLGFEVEDLNQKLPFSFQEIPDKTELFRRLNRPENEWKMSLFTSGTTGLPKKVEHNFQSLTRWVRINSNTQNNVWGFAYNSTHIAGLQVFFQALLNLNTIVYLFNQPRETVFSSIEKWQVTNLSATPTFFRMLLPANEVFTSVRKVTTGGEKFDTKLTGALANLFPNATFRNVYASTEAGSLFSAQNDIFTIKPEMTEFVKMVENELLIHGSLLGKSDSLVLKEGWYHTGDLVEILSDEPLTFRFLSRKNELINVGGYKVNPTEVEEMLNTHPEVNLSKIYGKPNSVIGTILCCDVVLTEGSKVTEKELRQFLAEKLQGYKIPRIFQFPKQLDITRTGKIKRI